MNWQVMNSSVKVGLRLKDEPLGGSIQHWSDRLMNSD